MTSFTDKDDLRGARFTGVSLRGSRFVAADLGEVRMRAVEIGGADIDAPWLLDGDSTLLVNGVDVTPYVTAELDRRFPGRAEKRAADPEGLRQAWAKLETAWAAAVDRAAAMPPGTVDVRVDGEWSFAETLRHMVMATDTWLRRAVLEVTDSPYHPIGMPNAEYALDGHDPSVFAGGTPPYDEVLAARAERAGMVRDYLATVTPEQLEETRPNPWGPEYRESVRSCLHTILEEEWEHLRYALRDLDAIETGPGERATSPGSATSPT